MRESPTCSPQAFVMPPAATFLNYVFTLKIIP